MLSQACSFTGHVLLAALCLRLKFHFQADLLECQPAEHQSGLGLSEGHPSPTAAEDWFWEAVARILNTAAYVQGGKIMWKELNKDYSEQYSGLAPAIRAVSPGPTGQDL